jgi:hypothetical protein
MADDDNNGIFYKGGLSPLGIAQSGKISKKDKELGPNQGPILKLDKIFENLYNQISSKTVGNYRRYGSYSGNWG